MAEGEDYWKKLVDCLMGMGFLLREDTFSKLIEVIAVYHSEHIKHH